MQTGAEHLIKIDKRLHCFFLPHDLFPQGFLEVTCCGTPVSHVQFFSVGCFCRCGHDAPFTVVIRSRLGHDLPASSGRDHPGPRLKKRRRRFRSLPAPRTSRADSRANLLRKTTPNGVADSRLFRGAPSAYIKAGRNTSLV